MNITFTPAVFKKFPRLQVVFILAEDIDNTTKLKESQHLLKEMALLVKQTFHKDTLQTHQLVSPWEVARQGFGKKAKHYHTSLETLLTQTLQSKNFLRKEVITNLIHFIALKHLVPISVDDVKKIEGKIRFDIARGNVPQELEKSFREREELQKGDIYYADQKKILGAKLDFWKNTTTQPMKKTTAVLIHFEALPPLTTEKIKKISAELILLLKNFCGGKIKGIIINKSKNKGVI